MKHVSWAVAALAMVLASTLQSQADDQACARQTSASAVTHDGLRQPRMAVRACPVEKSRVSHRHDKPQQNYSPAAGCIAFGLSDTRIAEVTK